MRAGDPMMLIESAIEREYMLNHWKRFWPAQFISADLSENDVLRALKALVQLGKLQDEAFLRCPGGHVAWQGSPAQLHEGFEVVCRNCDQVAEADLGAELQFTISPAWRERLDGLRADLQKKTPLNSAGSL